MILIATTQLNAVQDFNYLDASVQQTSCAYRLDISQTSQCFILTAKENMHDDHNGLYDIFFIKEGLIYEYNCLNQSYFEKEIAKVLANKHDNAIEKFMFENGFGRLSNNSISLNKRIENMRLSSINDEVMNLLDYQIIGILKGLGLNVIPRVYNWLKECSGSTGVNRINALMNFPLILAPTIQLAKDALISPTPNQNDIYSLIPASENLINEGIDSGMDIQKILRDTFNISQNTLNLIRGKKPWEIATVQNEITDELREFICAYECLSKN